MFKIYYSIAILVVITLLGCKKNPPLPELGIGNDLNPESGVEIVKVESYQNNYYGSAKALQVYYSVNTALLSSLNLSVKNVKVYIDGALFAVATPTQTYTWAHTNIVSGQTYNYTYVVVTSDDRETKESKPYPVTAN